MTHEDIIRMAREAGIDAESDTLCRYEGWVEPLDRFAALVRADERERIKAANAPVIESINEHIKTLEEALCEHIKTLEEALCARSNT